VEYPASPGPVPGDVVGVEVLVVVMRVVGLEVVVVVTTAVPGTHWE